MMEVKKGDKVRCIDTAGLAFYKETVVLGQVYTVLEVFPAGVYLGNRSLFSPSPLCFFLKEVSPQYNNGAKVALNAGRFTKISIWVQEDV